MLSLLPAINPHTTLTSFCAAAAAPSSSASPRPSVILPGLGNNTGDYVGLVTTLKERYDVPCVVAHVSRLDWFRNAAGLLDSNYWKGTLQPSPVLDWYLKRVEKAITDAKQLSEDDKGISLIGHSAGGWLARVYMEKFGISDISLLLTLGTPHLPPPKGVQGVIDQTRGLLDYVAMNCPPSVYTPELRYVCIAGRYIQGARITGGGSSSAPDENASGYINPDGVLSLPSSGTSKSVPAGITFRARFVGQGYKQVCGRADVWGDGVVPEMAAHLEGALNISLEGVYHSPVGSDDHTRPWYGSPSVVDNWARHLLQ